MSLSPCASGRPGSGGVWAEMDRLREQAREQERALKRAAAGEWRAFAKSEHFRFRGREGDPRIKVERPCFHVPGQWRAVGYYAATRLAHYATLKIINLKSHTRHHPLTDEQATAVLVAHDAWLEAGAKRMQRPLVIP